MADFNSYSLTLYDKNNRFVKLLKLIFVLEKTFFMKIRSILFCFVIFIGCQKENKKEKEIAAIVIETKIDRFDQVFAKAVPNDLSSLKKRYPYLFPRQFSDSVWIAQMKDTIQLELNKEVALAFSKFEEETLELKSLFQHINYYFSEKRTPKVVTITSGVDYENKAIYTDTLVLISLDTYLGEDHRFYRGIQEYISKSFKREMIVSDVTTAFANTVIPPQRERSFLSWLIYYGKELYLKDLLIPEKTDALKIGYTEEEFLWSQENESQVWRYFIEEDLLFSTDSKLLDRFINIAPFSKFYLELDAESPGRLGQYIGWQIVRAYMNNNNVSLAALLNTSADEIFNNSKYKPKK